MPTIRITKEEVDKAWKARKAALKEDSEFREFEKEMEKHLKAAAKQKKRETEGRQ